MRPVVICFDVEPDARTFSPVEPSRWDGFVAMAELAPKLRHLMTEATGSAVHFSWFLRMDPQVSLTWGDAAWPALEFKAQLAELEAAGDEIGVHVHDWRPSEDGTSWETMTTDPDWQAHCVTEGLDAYERAFGRPCPSHRAGDRQVTAPILQVLIDRGVRVDLTPEPGLPPLSGHGDETTLSASPDYRGIPTHPYRATPQSYPQPADTSDGPLLIPLLSARGRWFKRNPIPPIAASWRFGLALASERTPPGVPIALAIRSNLGSDQEAMDRITANLLRLGQRRDARFMTPSEAASEWEMQTP